MKTLLVLSLLLTICSSAFAYGEGIASEEARDQSDLSNEMAASTGHHYIT